MRYISSTTADSPGLLQKVAVVVVTVAMAGVALMFSAVLLTGILIVGTIAGGWLWWRTREVRKQMRQMQEAMQDFQARNPEAQHEAFTGEVIEGEVIRVDRSDDIGKR
jgi:uncharacterized protein HemX